MNIRIAAILATASLALVTSSRAEICGDVNANGNLTSTDALLVLRSSVGQQVILTCSSIAGLTECQGTLTDLGTDLSNCTDAKETCSIDLAACEAHTCGNNEAEHSESCDGADLHSETCASQTPETPYGKLLCDESCGFDTSGCKARFDASGATITDHKTGLEWEKKHGADATPDLADPSDVDNVYTWGSTSAPYAADGTLFLDFLAKLNGGLGVGTCLAGHCDWRIPTETELLSIVDSTIPDCGSPENPCVDPVFQPLHAAEVGVWSSTTSTANPAAARDIYLITGDTVGYSKSNTDTGRAVRTASPLP